jgi:Holliday junction resolvase RusA-like endonuclease
VDVIAVFPIAQSWAKKKQASALAGTEPPCVKPDHDNLAKSLDALNGIVWGDDKQIVFSRVFKIYGERPCLRVVVNRADRDGFVEAQRLLHIPLAAVA